MLNSINLPKFKNLLFTINLYTWFWRQFIKVYDKYISKIYLNSSIKFILLTKIKILLQCRKKTHSKELSKNSIKRKPSSKPIFQLNKLERIKKIKNHQIITLNVIFKNNPNQTKNKINLMISFFHPEDPNIEEEILIYSKMLKSCQGRLPLI